MRSRLVFAWVFVSLGLVLGFHLREGGPTAHAGIEKCSTRNGDVNADGKIDLSDAVTILGNLFLGSPSELPALCEPQGPTARIQELEGQLASAQSALEACRSELSACNTGGAGLPETGQTKCYDRTGTEVPCVGATCSGQDSYYHEGCPTADRFTDNGDGTVTDRCTGLMWQKETADADGDGIVSVVDFLQWCNALSYCENLSFAGHDDWRLPNVMELQSLVDYGRTNPSIDPVFQAFPGAYLTSTSDNLVSSAVWFVAFHEGGVAPSNKGNSGLVRAVRNAP